MVTAITKKNDKRLVARPLKVLIPLIKQDLLDGAEAAKRAAMEYYIAAGEKLIEAKATNAEEVRPISWGGWLNKNFHLSQTTARRYMKAAREKTAGGFFETLSEVVGDDRHLHGPAWTEPVRDALKNLRVENLNLRNHHLTQSKQRALERKLALQLIDIGYKVLSVKLHPDKGGSHDAMQRLNRVRSRLKDAA